MKTLRRQRIYGNFFFLFFLVNFIFFFRKSKSQGKVKEEKGWLGCGFCTVFNLSPPLNTVFAIYLSHTHKYNVCATVLSPKGTLAHWPLLPFVSVFSMLLSVSAQNCKMGEESYFEFLVII